MYIHDINMYVIRLFYYKRPHFPLNNNKDQNSQFFVKKN